MTGDFLGAGRTCTPVFPASFSMAKQSSITVHLRIAFPTTGYYGVAHLTATLQTGTCHTLTTTTVLLVRCTAVAPLEASIAPTASGAITVLPPSKIASRVRDEATTRPATTSVHQTFDVALQSTVGPLTAGTGLPTPTGTVTYKIDGTTVGAQPVGPYGSTGNQSTGSFLYDTTGLPVGRHNVTSIYSGNQFDLPSSLSETFTVTAAPSGTLFSCVNGGFQAATIKAYVTASGTNAGTTFAKTVGTVPVTNVSVAMEMDPAPEATGFINFERNGGDHKVHQRVRSDGWTDHICRGDTDGSGHHRYLDRYLHLYPDSEGDATGYDGRGPY